MFDSSVEYKSECRWTNHKGSLNIKQYTRKKPKKWGIKVYILAGANGLFYDFIIYQGSTTELEKIYSHFGSSTAVVMQLSDRIREPNHLVCFDNYFSSYRLFQYLHNRQIFAIGTARMNRFAGSKLLAVKAMENKGRGSTDVNVNSDGRWVILTQWYDNKLVTVGSNFVADGEYDNCRRWDRKQKKYIHVPRPEAIRLYNKNMGGVDKLDFLLSLYRSFIRSRRWTIRMIFHAVDMAVTNSWGEYRIRATALGLPKKKNWFVTFSSGNFRKCDIIQRTEKEGTAFNV